MVDVKVGDKFARTTANGCVIDCRTIVKMTDKSIWFEDALSHQFRVKNCHKDGYFMPCMKGSDYKQFFRLVKE